MRSSEELRQSAWTLLTENSYSGAIKLGVNYLLATMLYSVISMVVALIVAMPIVIVGVLAFDLNSDMASSVAQAVSNCVTTVFAIFISVPLMASFKFCALDMLRGKTIEYTDALTRTLRDGLYWKKVGIGACRVGLVLGFCVVILVVAMFMTIMVVLIAPDMSETTITLVLMGIFMPFFLAVAMVISLVYGMAEFILNDHPEYSAIDCMRESRKMMEGHKMELFSLYLSFVGWYLVAMLLCCTVIVPYLVTLYNEVAVVYFYEDLRAELAPASSPVVEVSPSPVVENMVETPVEQENSL